MASRYMRFLFFIALFSGSYSNLFHVDVVGSHYTIAQFASNVDLWTVHKSKNTSFAIYGSAETIEAAAIVAGLQGWTIKPVARAVQTLSTATYQNYSAVMAALDLAVVKYPYLAQLFVIGNSLEGRPIKGLRITYKTYGVVPDVVYLGVHHAREWISSEVVLGIMWFFLEKFHTNYRVRQIIQNVELWFVPLVNPDGFNWTWTAGTSLGAANRLWRKNRRPIKGVVYGVDINRNYGVGFGGAGSSSDPYSEVYRGTSAFSEPETTAVQEFLGQNSTLLDDPVGVLSYHSYGQYILYPPGYTYIPAENANWMQSFTSTLSDLIVRSGGVRYTAESSATMYLAAGDACDWFHGTTGGRPCFTMELRPDDSSSYGFELPASEISATVQENIAPAVFFADYLLQQNTSQDWLKMRWIATEVNVDQDGDGRLDYIDNCPRTANPSQLDTNGDGIGDACTTTELLCTTSATQVVCQAAITRTAKSRAAHQWRMDVFPLIIGALFVAWVF